MRAISLVNRIELKFPGNVATNALTLGDIDNDGCNELIVGNHNGEVSIFKGQQKLQTISNLNFVTCLAVGDIVNQNKNVLIIITADGWCYLYANPDNNLSDHGPKDDEGVEEVDGQIHSSSIAGSSETLPVTEISPPITRNKEDSEKMHLVCIHMQRIPANSMNIVLGDIDGDGDIEMVLGLTDRVVRSYKWIGNPDKSALDITDSSVHFDPSDKLLGKFVALNKWECANQIGSITIHHLADGKASILIAQPGGTFMRIKCQTDYLTGEENIENSHQSNSSSSNGENISGTVDYQFLGMSRMRNQNISTEILGDLRCSMHDSGVSFDKQSLTSLKSSSSITKGKPYALATLDGTIILVQDEVILWAIAVDHQIFALTKLDVTGNGSDDIVACSWDGETYILDQEKNSVRFHLGEAVQAFHSGYYSIKANKPDTTCLVYVTFKNTIIIYYDLPLKELTCKKFEPDVVKLSELFLNDNKPEVALEYAKKLDKKTKRELVEYLLYNS